MAYNVLKGIVEGSVDQYGDQEIDGVKVFKNTISASVFYDTDAQSPCATLKDVPLQRLERGTLNGLMTYQGDKAAKVEYNLTFDGTTLKTKDVRAERLYGSAIGLDSIPSDKFADQIPARHLKLGHSVRSENGDLEVRTHAGLSVTDEGLVVSIAPQGGLTLENRKLSLDLKNCSTITMRGQNLSDGDFLVVHDTSRGETRRTTLKNLYDSYINSKMHHPEGGLNSLQLKGAKGFAASNALTFNPKSGILNVDGIIKADFLTVNEKAIFENEFIRRGAVYDAIKKVSSTPYEVQERDYTLLCDTTEGVTVVTLPAPRHCEGRKLVIKKINTNKYKLNSNVLEVKTSEGLIDMHETITLKFNYSTLMLQSDGENWHILARTGT